VLGITKMNFGQEDADGVEGKIIHDSFIPQAKEAFPQAAKLV